MRSDRWRNANAVLAIVAVAQFMVILDASIVNVALPTIKRDVGFSEQSLLLGPERVHADLRRLPAARRPGRRPARAAPAVHGRHRVFAGASLAGGLSQSEGMLLVARGVQGLGAAIVSPAALSIILTTFAEGTERNRALWHLGRARRRWGRRRRAARRRARPAARLALGVLRQRADRPAGAGARAADRREPVGADRHAGYDVAGAVSITGGLMLLVYTLVKTNDVGWRSTRTIVRLAASAALIAAFVLIESRTRSPLMPLRIFHNRSVSSADAGLLVGAALLSMFFFLSLYLQQVLHYSALRTGISYLPLAVGIILAAGGASALTSRIGAKPVLIAGLAAIAGGMVLFSNVHAHGSYSSDVLAPSLIVALGLGFCRSSP